MMQHSVLRKESEWGGSWMGGKDNWISLVSTFLIRQEKVLLDWPRCVLSPSTIEIFYVPDDILLRIIPISWNSCKVLSFILTK